MSDPVKSLIKIIQIKCRLKVKKMNRARKIINSYKKWVGYIGECLLIEQVRWRNIGCRDIGSYLKLGGQVVMWVGGAQSAPSG